MQWKINEYRIQNISYGGHERQRIKIVALLGDTETESGLTGHVSLYCGLLDQGPHCRCNHTWSTVGGCTCVGTFCYAL